MIKFRNPSSDIATQIASYRTIYEALHLQQSFGLSDMERALSKTRMLTARGYSGQRAIDSNADKPTGLNSTQMNMKMFAEVYRLLGWIRPESAESSYPLKFTLIGEYAAKSDEAAFALVEQALLGYVNPSENAKKVKYTEQVRFFRTVLRALTDLDGVMYKKELCLGPMSVSDIDENHYQRMIESLKNLRAAKRLPVTEFQQLAESLKMQPNSVDNTTRMPIGFMKGIGWIETGIRDKNLYNKQVAGFRLTDKGQAALRDTEDMEDIRLETFRAAPENVANSLIRCGFFGMLDRAEFDIASKQADFETDFTNIMNHYGTDRILFSPYQTIDGDKVDSALSYVRTSSLGAQSDAAAEVSAAGGGFSFTNLHHSRISIDGCSFDRVSSGQDSVVLANGRNVGDRITELLEAGRSPEEIVETLFQEHGKAAQKEFYQLVADLFLLSGVNCSVSRAGDNWARWDAILIEEKDSLPIEIKSPAEELHISVKAVRQALENKIILLSGKEYETMKDTATLVVGYYLPNQRAEVERLIEDIKKTFDINILVIGLKDLLRIAVESVAKKSIFNLNNIRTSYGVIDAKL